MASIGDLVVGLKVNTTGFNTGNLKISAAGQPVRQKRRTGSVTD